MKKLMMSILAAGLLMLGACGTADTPAVSEEKTVPAEVTEAPAASPEASVAPTAAPVKKEEPEKAEEVDYEALYRPLLNRFYDCVSNAKVDEDYGEEEQWIINVLGGRDPQEVLQNTGYAIRDVSGDKIPELLVGEIGYDDYNAPLYTMYSVVDGKPVQLFQGWYRSAYFLMNNGFLYYQGSGSAFEMSMGVFHIHKDGSGLTCEDYYFSAPLDDSLMEIGFFHNTTGDNDPENAERMDVSDDEFWDIAFGLQEEITDAQLTPFTEYNTVGLRAEWAKDCDLEEYQDGMSISVGKEEVVFFVKEPVTDFMIFDLNVQGIDDNGKLVTEPQDLFGFETVTPDKPVLVGLNFPGDIPNNGIHLKDAEGVIHTFYISVSGMDGSLFLEEIRDTAKG